MKPLISVVVPCYNQAQYLDECLQSVLDQTFTDWECIIVNDGSPDNTEEVAKQWTEKYPRFKYLKKENGGLSSARNAGIEIAEGEWILPLDADDKIGKDYMRLAENEFSTSDLVYAKSSFFGIVNAEWNVSYTSYEKLLVQNSIYCSFFYKKKDWKKMGGYDENMKKGREDWDFNIRLLHVLAQVKMLDYEGFFYRRKENSMDSSLNNSPALIDQIDKYIYEKNLKIYNTYLPSYQKIYAEWGYYKKSSKAAEKKLSVITAELNKNLFTRFLYKIISLFS